MYDYFLEVSGGAVFFFLQKGNKSFLGRKKMGGKSGKFNYWSERF